MARLNLDVKGSIYAEFQDHCADDGRTVSDVVRQLVVDFNSAKRRAKYESKMMEAERALSGEPKVEL